MAVGAQIVQLVERGGGRSGGWLRGAPLLQLVEQLLAHVDCVYLQVVNLVEELLAAVPVQVDPQLEAVLEAHAGVLLVVQPVQGPADGRVDVRLGGSGVDVLGVLHQLTDVLSGALSILQTRHCVAHQCEYGHARGAGGVQEGMLSDLEPGPLPGHHALNGGDHAAVRVECVGVGLVWVLVANGLLPSEGGHQLLWRGDTYLGNGGVQGRARGSVRVVQYAVTRLVQVAEPLPAPQLEALVLVPPLPDPLPVPGPVLQLQ